MTDTMTDQRNTQKHLFKQVYLPKACSAWLLYKNQAQGIKPICLKNKNPSKILNPNNQATADLHF